MEADAYMTYLIPIPFLIVLYFIYFHKPKEEEKHELSELQENMMKMIINMERGRYDDD